MKKSFFFALALLASLSVSTRAEEVVDSTPATATQEAIASATVATAPAEVAPAPVLAPPTCVSCGTSTACCCSRSYTLSINPLFAPRCCYEVPVCNNNWYPGKNLGFLRCLFGCTCCVKPVSICEAPNCATCVSCAPCGCDPKPVCGCEVPKCATCVSCAPCGCDPKPVCGCAPPACAPAPTCVPATPTCGCATPDPCCKFRPFGGLFECLFQCTFCNMRQPTCCSSCGSCGHCGCAVPATPACAPVPVAPVVAPAPAEVQAPAETPVSVNVPAPADVPAPDPVTQHTITTDNLIAQQSSSSLLY